MQYQTNFWHILHEKPVLDQSRVDMRAWSQRTAYKKLPIVGNTVNGECHLVAIAVVSSPVPYHVAKSQQLIQRSGTYRWNLQWVSD